MNELVALSGLSNGWEFEVAALLSHIGCIALPPQILEKIHDGQELTLKKRAFIDLIPGRPRVCSRTFPDWKW